MNFTEAIKLIEEENYPHVRIYDINGKPIFDVSENSGTAAAAKLKDKESILASFGRVNFQLATDKIKLQNWKSAYTWPIIFTATAAAAELKPANQMQGLGNNPNYVSKHEADLMSKISGLEMQRDYDKKLAELEKRIDSSKKEEGLEKYLPMLGLFMDIDESKILKSLQLSQLMGAVNGQTVSTGIAGQNNKTSVLTTEAEAKMHEAIENNINELATKVEMANILLFLETLNKKPELLDTLIKMAAAYK